MTIKLRSQVLVYLSLVAISCLADERPNIVLIVADDVGFSDIGAFGGEIRTPNLDELASEGMQLTNFHAAPTCGPSRSMLMTSVDHHLAGAGINAAGLFRLPELRGRPGYEAYLNEKVVTFATLLQDAGYHTYMSGKWDPGNIPGRLPIDHGFDKSFVLAAGGASQFNDATGSFRPIAIAPYYDGDNKVDKLPEDFYSSKFYTNRIIDYIDSNDDEQPFLAYLSFTAAHWPLQVPDDWLDRYAGDYEDGWHAVRKTRFNRQRDLGVIPAHAQLPPQNRAVANWDELMPAQRQLELKRMRTYAAMIENMDSHIGRLLKSLKARDTNRETIIIFLSDNGAEGNAIDQILDNAYWISNTFDNRLGNLGRQGSYMWLGVGWAQAGVSPFRIYKSYTSAGGLRTPAIIHSLGGRIGRGMKDTVITIRDIAPTILELADVAQPRGTYNGKPVHPMTGKSILNYLAGRSETVHDDEPLGWELYGSRALIKGEWKALRVYAPEGSGEWELFNIKTDPTETADLAADFPDVIAELSADWDEYAKANGVAIFDKDTGYGRY